MRGLVMFISDIRKCASKEAEEKRVMKEMAKIREKFSNTRLALSGYDKKKYVWKLLYIFMLGYEVDFGHLEAVTLICSPRHSEKYAGYMAASLLLNPESPSLEQVSAAIRTDINSYEKVSQSLALATVANIGGPYLTKELGGDVSKIVILEGLRLHPEILKKAINCLSRLYKIDNTLIDVEGIVEKFEHFFDMRIPGVLMSACNLLGALIKVHGYEKFVSCYSVIVQQLYRLTVMNEAPKDYFYYQSPCPWLQVKFLKLLKMYPFPTESKLATELCEILDKILTHTEVTNSINKNNSDHSILFEVIKLIIYYKENVPNSLKTHCASLLGRFISVKEPNIRYLGLETMAQLAENPDSKDMIEKHQHTVLISLRDPDISIRKRALDVLFGMCSESNVTEIVEELLNCLADAEFNIKEDLVSKIALMSEIFGKDLKWYTDVIISLVGYAGDYVSDDIWHKLVQVVTGFGEHVDTELQSYAALQAYNAISKPHVHEKMLKLASYLVSEFSQYLVDQPGKDPDNLFETLNNHFAYTSSETKSMLLTAYMKLTNSYPELVDSTVPVFEHHVYHVDPELQQRAFEYYSLCSGAYEEVKPSVMEPMPTYEDKLQRQNQVLKRIVNMGHKAPPKQQETVDLLDL